MCQVLEQGRADGLRLFRAREACELAHEGSQRQVLAAVMGVGDMRADEYVQRFGAVPVRAGGLRGDVLLDALTGRFVNFALFRSVALSLIRERGVGVESGK